MKAATKTADNMELGLANAHHLPDAGESDTTSSRSSTISFSDAEDHRSWHSQQDLNIYLDIATAASVGSSCRESCDCCSSLQIVVENGIVPSEISRISTASKAETNCRICHLGLEETPESGVPIQLGCSCKHDLAVAHRQCAQTWFKIKGDKVCEICGSTAKNVLTLNEVEIPEQRNEPSGNPPPAPPPTESRSLWQGHRLLNFLLACMVFAFIISWLFHFSVPG